MAPTGLDIDVLGRGGAVPKPAPIPRVIVAGRLPANDIESCDSCEGEVESADW